MRKIAAEDAFAVLSEVPATLRACDQRIRTLETENVGLREKVASYETRDQVEKIAQLMEEKGIDNGMDLDEKRAMLLEKAAAGQLPIVKQAVELAARGNPLGELGERPPIGGSLMGYLLGQED